MRYDAGHKARTRDKVLSEAASMIREEGPHQVSVSGLMARAGLTHGGFYAHFTSKDDLVASAIGRMFEDVAAKLDPTELDRDPATGLKAYIDAYLSRSHRDHPNTGCPVPLLSADLPRLTPQARDVFGAGVARLTGRLAKVLAALGRPDPEALAGSMLSEMVGALALSRAVSDTAESDAILRRSRKSLKQRAGLE